MDSSLERSPPRQFLRMEVGNGEKRISLSWEPQTGILHLIRNGSEGNHLAISKKFELLKAERISDVIRRVDEVLASVFDDGEMIAAAKRMVAAMMSILPESQENKKSS